MSAALRSGRRFTGYRVAGAIAAVLLALVMAWQVYELFDGDDFTRPVVQWGVPQDGAELSGVLAGEALAARTRLQRDRFNSGPAPDADAPSLAYGDELFIVTAPLDDGAVLTGAWARPDEAAAEVARPSDRVIGISSLPYVNADLFERPLARDWRVGIADVATHLGAIAIVGFSFLLALMLAVRGRVPILHGHSDRPRVKRFGLLERMVHWMTAVSFIVLALTGIVIAYGETLIAPFSRVALGDIGWLSAWAHMMFFPSFALGVLVMAVMWTLRNLPERRDLTWLARGGGFFTDADDSPPAHKFNPGQKLVFWSAVLGGLIMVGTGVTLMFPYYWLDLGGMSWAMLTHAVIGVLLIAIFIGHIYIGTVGMEGAFWAMWGGDVDRNWAEEHHKLWVRDLEQGANRSPAE